MADEMNEQKQGGDKESTQTAREQYSAEEVGQASIYDDSTTVAQQMRRGNEGGENADDRDAVGATPVENTEEERTDRDTRQDAEGGGTGLAKD